MTANKWQTISTDEADRLLGLNSHERNALVRAGEQCSLDPQAVMVEAINDACSFIRGMLGNNLALRDDLKNTTDYAIPQSLKRLAYPLIIQALYIRYQLNLTDTRQKAVDWANEELEKYANGQRLPEKADGSPPADPAYMRPRFTKRPWFNPMRSIYR